MNIKRIFATLLAASVPYGLMWLHGEDFERGFVLSFMTAVSIFLGGFAYAVMWIKAGFDKA